MSESINEIVRPEIKTLGNPQLFVREIAESYFARVDKVAEVIDVEVPDMEQVREREYIMLVKVRYLSGVEMCIECIVTKCELGLRVRPCRSWTI